MTFYFGLRWCKAVSDTLTLANISLLAMINELLGSEVDVTPIN